MKQKKTFFRVLRHIRPHSFFVILSILCGAVSVAAQLLVPIFCGDAIDYMLGIGRVDFEAVKRLIFSIVLVTWNVKKVFKDFALDEEDGDES